MPLAWPIIRDLLALRDRLESLFDEAILEGGVELADRSSSSFCPAGDLYETDGEVVVVVEIPGVKAQSIDLQLEGNRLRISGEIAAPGQEVRLLRMERPRGPFHRDFELPVSRFEGTPVADLERGVLTVRLRKTSDGGRRRVVIVEDEG